MRCQIGLAWSWSCQFHCRWNIQTRPPATSGGLCRLHYWTHFNLLPPPPQPKRSNQRRSQPTLENMNEPDRDILLGTPIMQDQCQCKHPQSEFLSGAIGCTGEAGVSGFSQSFHNKLWLISYSSLMRTIWTRMSKIQISTRPQHSVYKRPI